MEIEKELRSFEADHGPDGWPAVRMHQISALCDEVDRLKAEVAELDALRDRLADLLTRTAVALRGPEPPLTRYSWHDIPDRAAAAVAAIDVMQRAAFMAADPELFNVKLTGASAPKGEEA